MRTKCLLISFLLISMHLIVNAQSCILTCPSNITVDATSSAGSVVNFSAPGSSGSCGDIISAPLSGSVFPIGTTTVTSYSNTSQLVYGLTSAGELLTFNRATPGTVSSLLPIVGLQAGEQIQAIDFRPSNGNLYGLGVSGGGTEGRLYLINTLTGVAAAVGASNFALPIGGIFSIDFNPIVDRIRLVSSGGLNLRLDPNLGTVAETDAVLNPAGIHISSIAYSNNYLGATLTTLYGIDFTNDALYIQGGLNGSISPNGGALTILGPLGISINNVTGFDISQGRAFASIKLTFGSDFGFYEIDLGTGAASLVGNIGNSNIMDIAMPIPGNTCSFIVTVNPLPPCILTCPSNITVDATSSAGSVVNFSAPGSSGSCGDIISAPLSGSVFPIGTTTVTSYSNTSQLVYGLTSAGELLTFNRATPGTVSSLLPIVGLQAGEQIQAIDFRPSNGNLYGLGVSGGGTEGRLYLINTLTGVAAAVGASNFALPIGGIFSIDFNPIVDRIRLVSSGGLNLRLDPNLGTVAETDAVLNPAGIHISSIAYSNNYLGATLTTLYGIDFTNDALYIQGGLNGSISPNGGALTILGPLGISINNVTGFDISQGRAFASIKLTFGSDFGFYEIDLGTGAASLVGNIGNSNIMDIAMPIPGNTCSFIVTVNPLPPCILTCPSNITVDATSSAGSVVNFSAPGSSGSCGDIISAPLSGSVFPIGTTTVTSYSNTSQLVYGLTDAGELLTFNRATPGTVSSLLPIVGLQAGEQIQAIDFRPSNGNLYGLGVSGGGTEGRLYFINTLTGIATAVGASNFALPIGGIFSIDFNPIVDRIRLVSSGGLNLRLDPNLGTVSGTDAVLNPAGIHIFSIAYSNNYLGATLTTLYGIDFTNDALYIQGGLNGSISPNGGALTILGPLGISINNITGFDISQGRAFASIKLTFGSDFGFYEIDLGTGAASLVGNIGNSNIMDIAMPIPGNTCLFTVTVNPLQSPPTVTINKAVGQSDPTSSSPINFTAIFDQAVTGFTSSDVSLSGTAGATTAVITEIAPNNGTTYNIAVSGMIANGTVIATISAGVVVNSSNVGNTASSSIDNAVDYVQPSPPTVTINKASTQADPTFAVPIHFTVEFDQVVTGFDAADISFTGSTVLGTLVATITGSGLIYDVSVSGMTTGGVVIASVIANAATNEIGQSSLGSTSTDNAVFLNMISHDIVVIKQGPPSVVAGNLLGYHIRVINASGSNTFGITFTDPLPVGTTFSNLISVQSIGLLAAPIVTAPTFGTNGMLTVFFPALAPGAQITFDVLVHVDANLTGSITNTATINGPPGDAIPGNNTSTVVTQIAVPPTITCPGNMVVTQATGECSTLVSLAGENAVVITGTPAPTLSYTILFGNGSSITKVDETSFPTSLEFFVGVNTVQIIAANDGGSASCSFTVTVTDNQPPIINCPSDITVNAQAGQCSSDVLYSISGSESCYSPQSSVTLQVSTGFTSTLSGALVNSFLISSTKNFPVGTSTVHVLATDGAGNTATCSFNVTVVDNEKPLINCPAPITVSCASEIPVPDISAASASDNCGSTTITHVGDIITNQTCANKYTLTRTYRATDGSGNTATCSQLITVDDNTPPQITGLTSSKQVLWPANHKMVDVMLNYTVNDNCVSTPNVTINIISNEAINGTGDGDTDPDWEVIDDHHVRLRAERAANGTGRIYTITVTVSDGCNASVSATTQVMVVHNITAPHSGNSFKVGSTVAFSGEFWDKPGNKHTAKWQIDGSTTTGVVTEPLGNKNGKVIGSYKFNTPGIYKLQMNVTDQTGLTTYANTNGDLEAIVVIYDPNGGYTYGGGYYDSRAGGLVSNPSTTGKASYGFVMNYFKNSTNPKGETQFEFKVGDFEFNALNFDYLVISNSMAQFKGTGKIIGGQSGVAFTMTVTDGQLNGSGIDKIRMKIYNKNNGKIIYDNQPGASDAALPTQAVGANSIVVISGMNSSLTSANTNQKAEMEATETKTVNGLDVIAYPNPSINSFSIKAQANAKEKITMQVIDMYGRIIETRNVTPNSITRFGDRYRPGTYFVRIIQGKERRQIKLVKLAD